MKEHTQTLKKSQESDFQSFHTISPNVYPFQRQLNTIASHNAYEETNNCSTFKEWQ